jgi:hypothetical protein
VPVLELNADSAAAVQQMGPSEANTLAMAPPPASIANTTGSGDSTPAPKPAANTSSNSVSANNVVERKGPAAPAFDYTHLGPKGSAYFARMVCDELISAVPELKPYILPKK